MLSAHRHDTILKRLESNGRIRAIELAHELVVSEETIRRDLTELEALGRLRRVHGGAVQFRPDEEQPLLDARASDRARSPDRGYRGEPGLGRHVGVRRYRLDADGVRPGIGWKAASADRDQFARHRPPAGTGSRDQGQGDAGWVRPTTMPCSAATRSRSCAGSYSISRSWGSPPATPSMVGWTMPKRSRTYAGPFCHKAARAC